MIIREASTLFRFTTVIGRRSLRQIALDPIIIRINQKPTTETPSSAAQWNINDFQRLLAQLEYKSAR